MLTFSYFSSGMFYQLIRILKKYPKSIPIVEKTMQVRTRPSASRHLLIARALQVLKRFGSLEEHIIKAVENDIVGKTASTCESKSWSLNMCR